MDLSKITVDYKELFAFREMLCIPGGAKEIRINSEHVIVSLESMDEAGGKYTVDMVIDPVDEAAVPVQILNAGKYEREELNMVMRIAQYMSEVNGGGALWDIGANHGWYTLNVCKRYENIRGYAFEPAEDSYRKMMYNVRLNGLKNCSLYNIGLSTENGQKEFYYNTTASGASSLVNLLEDENTKLVRCNFERMDDFAMRNRISEMDLIKCDVEGAELLVYQGGLESIKKYRPVVFSEMLRKWSAKFHYYPNQIIELFEGLGYQCYVIRDGGLREFGRVDEETVETNYFFLHREEHAGLLRFLER